MECIVLAGGLGTRLRNTIGDYPKCMAEVAGRPFLEYVFNYLEKQQCERVILSLGYKHEIITAWLEEKQYPMEVAYVVEKEPLGTGGGIQLALKEAINNNVAVFNGDTIFSVDLGKMLLFHEQKRSATTIALKSMKNFDRYGVVNTDMAGRITAFEEKQYKEQGYINGGIYIIDKTTFLSRQLPEKFSFEKDYLERHISEGAFYGYESDSYFIDIGIPEDYAKAQTDFKNRLV
jgi:D-glycero-alpha-D-manno-heptose 1-phosphate guanylyltransferase